MSDRFPEPLPAVPLPENEAGRLEALRRYDILDTPPEAAFDRITALAARLFAVPVAVISLVDESRLWFKSCYGIEREDIPRENSFCGCTVMSNEIFVVPDAQQDARFIDSPLVRGKLGLRFYAGAPLVTQDGFTVGTLCLIDTQPRATLSPEQQTILSDLAAMVVDELDLRLAARKVSKIDTALLEITQGISVATGEAFFSALVQHFTKTLAVDFACISLVDKTHQDTVQTLAVCSKGQITTNFKYQLSGTPCQQVIQSRRLLYYSSCIQTKFPEDEWLKSSNIESYAAMPFFDSAGTTLGLLSIMDSKPLANLQLVETLLPIFALRIATELERQQTEAAAQQVQQRLKHLVEQQTAELSQTNQRLQLEIAERQLFEQALQNEQEMLKVLLDNVQAGIVACDAEGTLTLFNHTARELHGLSERPLPPEQWAEYYSLYHADGKTLLSQEEIPLFRALQGETVHNVEMVIAPKSGQPRTLLASGQAIVDTYGIRRGAVAVMHDITERKQMENAIRHSEARRLSIFQTIPDGVIILEPTGKIVAANSAAEQILGITRGDLLERVYDDPGWLITTVDGQPFPHAELPFARVMQTGKPIYGVEHAVMRSDGARRILSINASPLFDAEGRIINVVTSVSDITERKQAEAERIQLIQEQAARMEAEADQRRSAFLVEISTALTVSLDYEQTLQSVAQLAVPYFADWCSVDLLNDDGSISRVAVAHSDPEKVQFGWGIAERFPRHIDDGYGISEVMKTGRSEIAIAITEEQLAAVPNPEYLEILRGMGIQSCIISPLQARGRVLGSISFVFTESNRHYSHADLTLAEDLARRAAIAIDNARLYYTVQQAKQTAEVAADRTARLQAVTAALAESLTPQQVADVVAEQSMAALGAKSAIVALVSPDRTELEIVKSVEHQTDVIESWRRFSIHTDVPLAKAVRTGEPQWLGTLAERMAEYPHLAHYYKQYNYESWMSLPLVVEGIAIGGLALSFTTYKHLTQADREFMLALSRQCAQAISRAQLYEAERQARAEAEQANRVKDEFLAVLSHELRTPLNPILGWSKLLQTRYDDPKTLMRGLQTIERNAKLQTQLIEDLLDISRILRGKLSLNVTPVDLKSTIEAAMETVQLAAEAKAINLQFVVPFESDKTGYPTSAPSMESTGQLDPLASDRLAHLQQPALQVSGDAARLQQVVWNLLSNAVKFTPDGGRVEIRLERIEKGSDSLMALPLTAISSRAYAQITITDTGQGILPEFLPHIFERFRQADSKTTRKFGGLGLGLAIVRQLVELHGGTVQADSLGEGQGSTFTVQLPLLKQQDNHPVEDPSPLMPLSSYPLMGVRILVVDDDTDTRELLVFVLEEVGASVTSIPSASEALTWLATSSSKIDVLISDIGMPDMDGYMMMQHIHSRFADPNTSKLPFSAIALTAYAEDVNQQKALAAGFHHYLSKPVEPNELVLAIASLI